MPGGKGEGSPSGTNDVSEGKPAGAGEGLKDNDLEKILKKLGDRGHTAIIAKQITDEDYKNVINEAVDKKIKMNEQGEGFEDEKFKKAKSALIKIPVVKDVVKAFLISKYKKQAEGAISEKGLSAAYKELGIKDEDRTVLEGSESKDFEGRALSILESAGFDNRNHPEEASSRLNKNETVKQVEKETQKKVTQELNQYYLDFKESKGKNNDELRKAFDKKIDLALAGEKNPEPLKEAIKKRLDDVEKLAKDNEIGKEQVESFLTNHVSLYRANFKEGINAKKELDSYTKAILTAGGAAGVITVVSLRLAKSLARKGALAVGASTGVAGGIVGGIAGAARGADKARVNLSASEIENIAKFNRGESSPEGGESSPEGGESSPEGDESSPEGKEPSEEKGDKPVDIEREKKKKGILALINEKFSDKKYDTILDDIEKLRNRKKASDLIADLNDAIDGKGEKDLYKIYAEIIERSNFSSENGIDLITFKGDERSALEKLLGDAEKKLTHKEDLKEAREYIKNNPHQNEKEEYREALRAKFKNDLDKAQESEKDYKKKVIKANFIKGATIGTVFGALAGWAEESGVVGGILHGESENVDGETSNDIDLEKLKAFKGKPVLIENDPNGGMSIGIDKDGDGLIDTDEFLRGEGDAAGIDLTDDQQFEELNKELSDYKIELQREAIDTSRYGETSIDNYLENANNTVDTSGGIDWSRSATKVAFGTPTATIEDGMDNYEVPVWGVNGEPIPDGAKFYIDLDGEGPGDTLEYTIENGKAIVPADVLDTSHVGNGGAASFIGTARVGEMDGNTMISYATAFGKDADLSSTISASTEGTGYAFTAVDMDTGEGLSQFAVDADNKIISNMSEIYNGIEVGGSERMPVTFMVKEIGDDANGTTLASGEKIIDLDYKGGYHPEYDSYQNDAFIESKSFLGTPIKWDLDGDGQMNSAEEATFFKQLLVRTGTDPFVLAQNASNYGLLEPGRLEEIIPRDQLIDWGIKDGTIDNMTDLNVMIEHLKMPENAELYDKLVNSTINEMQSQMDGGSFTVETITDRASTYTNSSHEIDAWRGSNARTILYARNKDGEIIGNQGVVCRTLGIEGGKVGTLTDCGGQTGGELDTPRPGSGSESTPGSGDESTPGSGDESTPGSGDESTPGSGDEGTGDEETGDEIVPKTENTHAGDETDLPVTPPQGDDYVQPTPDNYVDPNTTPGSQVNDGNNSAYNPVDHGGSTGDDTKSTYTPDTSKWKGDNGGGGGSSSSDGGGGGGSSNADPGSATPNVPPQTDDQLAEINKN